MNATPLMLGVLLFAAAAGGRAQSDLALSRASNFNRVEYYELPDLFQKIKARLSGAEATPQPGGLLAIKQLRVETFDTNGEPKIVVTAPECVYDPINDVASSAGPLQVRAGNGKFYVAGEGFLWRQSDSSLTISNQVHSIIDATLEMKSRP